MRRVSDASLMKLVGVLPIVAAVAIFVALAIVVWLISTPYEAASSPILGFVAAQVGWLVAALGVARKEAARRAGGAVGVESWRLSNGWAAPAFRLNHDYDPDGSDFQALLRIIGEHGYALKGTSQPVSDRSGWQLERTRA